VALVLPQRSVAFHVLVNVLVQVVPAVTSETILQSLRYMHPMLLVL
jgi:hypothetical protein